MSQTGSGLRAALRRFSALAKDNERVLIGDAGPDVGKVFMVCDTCGRVRPMYRIAERRLISCRCGAIHMRPRHIPGWRAAWWVFVVGGLWRRLILRKQEAKYWEPRMQVRFREPQY